MKQGCPLSPTLFSLYIADFERRVLAAAAVAAGGTPLDLHVLAGTLVPPLFYADDCALLATSAQGLQAQLRLLEAFCAERGLTVNLAKTKVVLLAGADSEEDALQRVQSARLTYGGGMLEAAPEFKYLGVVFHCCRPIGESAAPAERILFDCVAHRDLRALHPEFFPAGQPRAERRRWRPSWRAPAGHRPPSPARADDVAGERSGLPPQSQQHGQLPHSPVARRLRVLGAARLRV